MSKTQLRAVLVCVDYHDLLTVTLPYNRHHFSEVMVVTTEKDTKTQEVARANDASILTTNLFYEHGANFNKWRALERALDVFGRDGILCLMDADILWPKVIMGGYDTFKKGRLYTPLRHMAPWPPRPGHDAVPLEIDWWKYPIHRNVNEWAGYTQIFHADDPVLGDPPWHETDWTHAGGADSFFQKKWKPLNKIRPLWEVLHLGEAGANWMGRVTQFPDGTTLEEAGQRRLEMTKMWHRRRNAPGATKFDSEKITPSSKDQERQEE